jgi:hypothetical protein
LKWLTNEAKACEECMISSKQRVYGLMVERLLLGVLPQKKGQRLQCGALFFMLLICKEI